MFRALVASVATAAREWSTSLALFALCCVASGMRVLLALAVVAGLQVYAPGQSVGTALLSLILQHLVLDASDALLGALLLSALFIWYADSRQIRLAVRLRGGRDGEDVDDRREEHKRAAT